MSTYELTFVINPIDDDTIDRLAENGIDWSQMGRLQFAHVDQTADAPLSAIRAAHIMLETLGVQPRRLRLDLVSASEIAARAGVSRPAVAKWTKQVTGDTAFPTEFDWSTTGPIWVWRDVNKWLQRTGKTGYDECCSLSLDDAEEGDRLIADMRSSLVGR
ncbi:hypothetical protein [Acidipropionibacterium virtanenii]|uniref:DNA-binding protein n=1 Tax=Acidipropionibacterium virtanenii TaxID=2057246 RepID=A0A344UR03_9ACTN|nr:hypothetical protein [Acidipropionibacterium virtanenii]AXE37701.1 hypothetical protein JS278_00508 [Acidipropionibacterium virtanenii]